MKKRMLSILLTLCMLISLVTVGASAASGDCGENMTWSFDQATGTLTISGTGEMDDYRTEGEETNPAPWHGFAGDITTLVIGEGVASIGSQAFRDTGLTVVDLSKTNVTKIGSEAFASSDLTSITLPNGLTEIASGLFMNCSKLEDVMIPDSVTSIGAEAFMLCSKLDFLNIPASVTEIGGSVFRYGPNEFRFEGSVPQMKTSTFANSGTTTIYYPKGNTTWNDEVFNANWGSQITWIGYAFTDVPFGAFYTEAVEWAVANDITNGTTPTTFSPDNECTRGQVVTFLWRAAGSPEPTSTEHPFTDLDENRFYYKAVLWAVENEITTGATETTFDPNGTCTRSQVAAFLWRAAGSPEPEGQDNPFIDVTDSRYYYDAVLWAAENDITQGDGEASTFNPNGKCTRGQIVTFLYRFKNN